MRRTRSILAAIYLMTCFVCPQASAQSEPVWQWQLKIIETNHQKNLVWQRADGPALVLDIPSFAVSSGKSPRVPVNVRLVSDQIQNDRARLEYALTVEDHGTARQGTLVLEYHATVEGPRAVMTRQSSLHFAEPLRLDLTVAENARFTGKPATVSALPLREGVVKMLPTVHMRQSSGYFQLGRGSTPKEGEELALPLIGLWISGGVLTVATDPYCGAQFDVHTSDKTAEQGSAVKTSYIYAGSVVPIHEERRTEVYEFRQASTRVFYEEGVDWMLASFYDAIPELHPSPAWIQDIQLDYYDYISSYKDELGQGWYHDVQTLADKIPAEHRGKVVLCLHGYYDYVGSRFCYDQKKGRLIDSWVSYDKDAHSIPMSLAEVHRRIKFAKDRGFHVVLLYGDGTAADTSTPYYRPEWMIKDANGHYPSRGFWEWRPDIKVKRPPGGELKGEEWPTNRIMDPAMPAVHDWFMGYTQALLNEYGHDLDGFVWDEAFLIVRDLVSYATPEPSYSDRAMMHLVSDISQLIQQWHKENPNLVFLVADNALTPYGLAAHGTWQDSECAPQMWAPGLLLNYRNCLWSCLWYPVSAASHNRFAVENYRLPQGLGNGWGDNVGPAEMPKDFLDEVVNRFLTRIGRGGDRIRYLLSAGPSITSPDQY